MAPNLELVTGSFFTGKSKAGSVLGEREEAHSEACKPGNLICCSVVLVNQHKKNIYFSHKSKKCADMN